MRDREGQPADAETLVQPYVLSRPPIHRSSARQNVISIRLIEASHALAVQS